MIVGLNVLYAWPLPHWLLRYTRKIDIVIIFAGPLLFAYALGFFDGGGPSWAPGHRGYFLMPYAVFCPVLGLTPLPAAIVLYHLRQPPANLVGNRSEIVDVAEALGYVPAGTGRKRRLVHLPFNQVFQVEFARRVLELPRLPAAWDGLTILHLTDLHLC